MISGQRPHPRDKTGAQIDPFDLVVLGEIPEHYYADVDEPSARALKSFAGKYGLVTYELHEPFRAGRPDQPGWAFVDGTGVYVVSHAINEGHVSTYDFWLDPRSLIKIPFNILIMSIFSDLPWEMTDGLGPSSRHTFTDRTFQYEHVKRVLEADYEKLCLAHDAAMDVLEIK